MEKYFRCPSCNDVRVATPKPYQHVVAMQCRCKDSFGFKVQMEEITAAEYHQGKAPTKKPTQSAPASNYGTGFGRDRHYDQIIWDNIFGGPATKSPPKPKVYKCSDCGQNTQSGPSFMTGQLLCSTCAAIAILRIMQQIQQAQAAQTAQRQWRWQTLDVKRVRWHYCHGCGDLLPEHDGLHKCSGSNHPVLTIVEFEEKPTMTPITNVRIWWDASVNAYRLSSPYSKDLVEGLKATIPISDRSFDPTTKIWTFVERQLDPLQKFLRMMNVTPVIIMRQQAEQASQSTPQGPRKGAALAEVALEFIRVAGPDAMQKAYRAAAMTLHPDRGGSMDKMSALNAAWERLQKEVYGSN